VFTRQGVVGNRQPSLPALLHAFPRNSKNALPVGFGGPFPRRNHLIDAHQVKATTSTPFKSNE
jgi:hypothetical protein